MFSNPASSTLNPPVSCAGHFSLPADGALLQKIAFYVKNQRLIIRGSEDASDETCGSMFSNVKNKLKSVDLHANVVEVELLADTSATDERRLSPAITCTKIDDKAVQFPLLLTSLCYVSQSKPLCK